MKLELSLKDSFPLGGSMHTNTLLPAQLNLLLVDDEEFNIKALKRSLHNQGFTIFCASDGYAALDIMAQEDIAIIVADMHMPGMGGEELLTSIWEHWPNTQRIVLTGYNDAKEAIDVLNKSNIYRYISKPWDDEYLLSTIHEAAALYWGTILDSYYEKHTLEENEVLKTSNQQLKKSFIQSQEQLKKLNVKLRHSYEEERTLKEGRREAERLSEAKSRFLATMSHEIRTPLNSMIATNSLLLESELRSEQRELALLSFNGANTLLAIINDILDFSKINAGRLELKSSWFGLLDMVYTTAELFSGNLKDKCVEIVVVVEPGVPVEVLGDKGRIDQILTNLISNAIKFTEEGCVTITMKYEDGLVMEVRDSGCGMESAQLGCIFDEFTQIDNSRTRQTGGTGLGLSICKKLCQLMGGSIAVSSYIGTGSTFTVSLPLKACNFIGFPRYAEHGKRILLLSHNEVMFRALKSQLGHFNCELQLGSSLLNKYNDIYDAILYDMDSLCFLKKNIVPTHGDRKVPQIALISSDGVDKSIQLKKNGFEHIIRKPINLSSILKSVLYQLQEPPSMAALSEAQQEYIMSLLSEVEQESADHSQVDISGAKILLAEDSPSNQAVITCILSNMDVSVEVAADGAIAVSKASESHFDLILMDVRMPIKDGLTAAQEIIQGGGPNSTTPIIALTANAYAEDRQDCAAIGMVDFISKPIDIDTFRACLGRWYKRPQSQAVVDISKAVPKKQALLSEDYIDVAIIHQLEKDTSPEVLPKIIHIFLDETDERLRKMLKLVAAKDWESLADNAHTLKSSAGSFGALKLRDSAKDIEQCVNGGNFSALQARMNKLADLGGRTLHAFRTSSYV